MNPVLIEQIQRRREADHERVEAQEHERRTQQHMPRPVVVPRLAQSRGEVVVGGAVMDHMRRPPPPHGVGEAVLPVVDEVARDERREERQRPRAEVEEPELPHTHQQREARGTQEEVAREAPHTHAHRGRRVTPRIAAPRPPAPHQPPLQRDAEREQRGREEQDVGECELGVHEARVPGRGRGCQCGRSARLGFA